MILPAAYLVLTAIITLILISIGFRAIHLSDTHPGTLNRKKSILIGGFLLWHLYVFFISRSGILQDFGMPPRLFLLLVLPLFLFTGIFLFRKRNHQWLHNIPKTWPIFYQSFRVLIETLFVFSVARGVLPKEVTMEGYNFDVVFGISALVVAYLFQKNHVGRKVIIAWNYLGLAVIAAIIFLFLSTTFAPQLYGSDTPLMPLEAISYPYTLVAGFLMPSAVFMHVFSLVQLHKRSTL